MNTDVQSKRLPPADLTTEQQERLFTIIAAMIKEAIDVRAPKNRPPGRAGLRAEKGYYRLLYVEGDFYEKIGKHANIGQTGPPFDWAHLTEMLRQLADIPELREQIAAGIETALASVTAPVDP